MLALGVWVTIAAANSDGIGYDPPRNFTELAALVAAIAALIVGVGVIVRAALRALRAMRRALEWVESIHDLTQRELELASSDGTVAEELHGVAVSLGVLQRRADELTAQVASNSRRLSHVESDLRSIYDPHHRNPHREDI